MLTGNVSIFLRSTILGVVFATATRAQHQTEVFSPIIVDGSLPYQIDLVPFELGDTPLPSLHSYAKAQWDGKWLLIGGRTNGLHEFTQNGFINFPPAHQNREIWVVDPVHGKSWRRSMEEEGSGLTTPQIDSLSVTNNQFYQKDDRLYLTGGYGLEAEEDFVTFDTLTAIDVPGIMAWVQGGDGNASSTIRQIHNPLFRVTGGAMLPIGDRTHLVFGQDFQGPYTPFGNGIYTNQVRSFTIVDDGIELSVDNVAVSEPDENYRRRDLNVLPVIRPQDDGMFTEELRVLSGVFTPEGGAWTVPVEIDSRGNPMMADPADDDAFKQAMNLYHTAKISLYSESSNESHMLLFGGISLHYIDPETNQLSQDANLPFINQATSVVIDRDGKYEQHLLPEEFPEFYDSESGNRLLYGTNAEFMLTDGISAHDNGVIKMDDISGPTTLGYIVGGIAADQPNNGFSAASGRIFKVVYTPVSAPSGDLDQNGVIDARDIDLLISSIRESSDDERFDVNQSGHLDHADLTYFVESILETWLGDANLDGEFGSSDLVAVFRFSEYEDDVPLNSTWGTGDWNGDGEFSTTDFVAAFRAGGYEMGPRTSSVPEPGNSIVVLLLLLFALRRLINMLGSHNVVPI